MAFLEQRHGARPIAQVARGAGSTPPPEGAVRPGLPHRAGHLGGLFEGSRVPQGDRQLAMPARVDCLRAFGDAGAPMPYRSVPILGTHGRLRDCNALRQGVAFTVPGHGRHKREDNGTAAAVGRAAQPVVFEKVTDRACFARLTMHIWHSRMAPPRHMRDFGSSLM